MEFECKKIKFETEEDARAELQRIVEGNDWRIWKQPQHKNPCRAYQCKCGSWHLTSQPKLM